ncbi:hypothetical protein K440DRAFT_658112 [Wilcoxina mikolae CBS 423.85]|nr:hypothetical protein K440DRAFT_658112 [Wilcoxina mikolae CBS 423.85]
MSLSPFPPRDIPPPVPPKTTFPLPVNGDVANVQTKNVEKPGRKKSVSSMNKIDTVSDLRPIRPTKTRSASSPPPVRPSLLPPSPEDTTGRVSPSNPQSVSRPPSRLATAREKARDIWMSRRKGSSAGLEPVKSATVLEPCLDSPTLPELSSATHSKQNNTGDWRQGFFGEPVETEDSSISYKAPMSAPPSIRFPNSLWPPLDNRSHPTIVPSKALAVLQTPPVLIMDRYQAPIRRTPERSELPERAESDMEKTAGRSRQPVDVIVAPLHIRKNSREMYHKRKKSSVSASPPYHRVRPSETSSRLPRTEFALLQRKAMRQTEKFNVLSLHDVEQLSHELLQLDARCEYLRQTRSSLRQGRRTLHTRMITYLKSARPGTFSQDNLLKQEETLADLDNAIEDWENKLEKAEKRRAGIKEKLLEHVAAALRVVNNIPEFEDPVDTPPASPGELKRQRHDREAITVYALLADVKQEVERTVICTT